MKKTYILDTNVLLSDSTALLGFDEHNVVLPLIVIEELDRHKDRQDEVGKNARDVVRKLAELTLQQKDIKSGVPLGRRKGTLFILSVDDVSMHQQVAMPQELSTTKSGDNQLVEFCLNYKHMHSHDKVILVTRDTVLRLKGHSLGITCEDYRKLNVVENVDSLFTGVRVIDERERDDVKVDEFYSKEFYVLPDDIQDQLFPNQFVVIKNDQQSAMARFIDKGEPLRRLTPLPGKLTPRNKEQQFARELLFDQRVKLVTLSGKSGSGKSICALDAGLEQVLNSRIYRTLVICRPVVPVGRDIGFLPGVLEEKLDPWLTPIRDNLRFLLSTGPSSSSSANNKRWSSKEGRALAEHGNTRSQDEQILRSYFEEGIIETQALAFIRGRTIANAFIMVDECFPGDHTIVVDGNKAMRFDRLYKMYSEGQELPAAKTFNEQTGRFEYRKILNVKYNGLKPTVKLTMANRHVEATANHKFLTKQGWKTVDSLSVGDLIIATDAAIRVDDIDFSNTEPKDVYDLEVEETHNYVVCLDSVSNGFVAHNCQNVSPHEIKTILTRAGENSKIVLCGDTSQIDVPYMDSVTNGMSVVIEKFKHTKIAGHVTFVKGERSELATVSADIL